MIADVLTQTGQLLLMLVKAARPTQSLSILYVVNAACHCLLILLDLLMR